MKKIMYAIQGGLSLVVLGLNTLFTATWLFSLAILKAAIPIDAWRKLASKGLIHLGEFWIGLNNLNLRIFSRVRWNIAGLEDLKMNDWYLVLSNHQAWSDIFVLQKTFNRKIPFLKFFLKKELIWVPVMGLAWWALDYPFMSRHTKEFLAKHPNLKGKDLETTKKACEKFKTLPVSIMNFVEGTRFTQAKHDKQKSPYAHLLMPKAAGIAYVLAAMGGQLHKVLNVTIVYPNQKPSMWKLFSGQISEVKVKIESLPITPKIMGDYFNDEAFRTAFQNWLNQLWADKDLTIAQMSA